MWGITAPLQTNFKIPVTLKNKVEGETFDFGFLKAGGVNVNSGSSTEFKDGIQNSVEHGTLETTYNSQRKYSFQWANNSAITPNTSQNFYNDLFNFDVNTDLSVKEITRNFRTVYPLTIKNSLVENGSISADEIYFKDPTTDNQFHTYSAAGSGYVKNEAFELLDVEIPGYGFSKYSVKAKTPIVYNSRTYYYVDGDFNPSTATDLYLTGPTTKAANYKGTGLSNNPNAYANNGQRKFVRSSDGWLHNVYESMGKVYYETSSNNGATWQIMNGGKPLTGSDAKLPAITFFENNWSIITYQKNTGGTYALETVVFNYPGDVFNVNQPALAFQSYASYQSTSNPVIAFGQQSVNEYIALVWQTTASDGLGWDPGLYYRLAKYQQLPDYSYGYVWQNSPTKIPNTNVNSVNPAITVYDNGTAGIIEFHIAWQQNNPSYYNQSVIKYIQMDVNWSNSTTTFAGYYEASSGSGYLSNYKPSITMYGPYPTVAWIAEHTQTLIQQAILRIKFTNWSTFYSYSYSGGDNVESISINRDSYGFVLSWGGDQRENQYITDNSTTNIYSLSTTGDVQVSNADVLGNIKVMAFNKYNSPYAFTSAAITQGLSKTSGKSYVSREAVIKSGSNEYYFSFGDIAADENNINFVEIKDSLLGADKKSINNYLLSEPFALNDNSNLSFKIEYGIKDSSSYTENKTKDNQADFKLELIDEQNGDVLGILNEVSTAKDEFRKANNSSKIKVDTKGIGNKKVRLRLSTTENNFDNFAIITKVSTEETLSKTSAGQTLAFDGKEVVEDYTLSQNYPNPFNPSTIIKYQLPENGFVTLKVYDILGKEVKTLVNEYKSSGRYEVTFDGDNLASGVYVYKLDVNNFSVSRKFILMK